MVQKKFNNFISKSVIYFLIFYYSWKWIENIIAKCHTELPPHWFLWSCVRIILCEFLVLCLCLVSFLLYCLKYSMVLGSGVISVAIQIPYDPELAPISFTGRKFLSRGDRTYAASRSTCWKHQALKLVLRKQDRYISFLFKPVIELN